MRHASLFTGIGGFDLASDWLGWQNVFQVEIDTWCQSLLSKRFPETAKYTDIKAFDAKPYYGTIDVISGGFPCQPFSTAGKRLGTEDDRHLWPEMLRVVREIQPKYVVGENVRGLTNWNGGLVFEQVQADLELAGYDVISFVLPACSVDAPHRRDRIWIVAHRNSARLQTQGAEQQTAGVVQHGELGRLTPDTESEQGATTINGRGSQQEQRQLRGSGGKDAISNSDSQLGRPQTWELPAQQKQRRHLQGISGGVSESRTIADYQGIGLQGGGASREQQSDTSSKSRIFRGNYQRPDWTEWPSVSPICRADDGISDRVDRLKALGNAIVPQVAYQIFKTIEAYEANT